MIRDIPIDRIIARSDARAIDEATVGGLADSIGAVGLINPIRVRAIGDQWEVVAGMHRLAASKRLGLVDIAADVIESDDLHAELAMIDENLCRAELSPADRAAQTARRKAIYLELHPETGHGGDRKSDQVAKLATRSFDAETASATGQSERVVRRDAERGEKVIPEVLEMIRGTKLDTGAYLDKIKSQTPNDQFAAAKRDLAHMRAQDRERASGIQRRVAPLSDAEAKEKWIATGLAWWNRGPDEWRDDFRSQVDTPVFDRGAA